MATEMMKPQDEGRCRYCGAEVLRYEGGVWHHLYGETHCETPEPHCSDPDCDLEWGHAGRHCAWVPE